jgi:putative chitinase
MKLTTDILKKICPAAKDAIVPIIVDSFNKGNDHYEINTKQRIAHFISQVAHECSQFNHFREIASGEAYEGRKDLGNTEPGDGKKYRGVGAIQVTGKNNIREASRFLFNDPNVLLNNPELLEQPENAILSAFWYWNTRNLNKVADRLDSDRIKITYRKKEKLCSPLEYITYRINGGFNGLDERSAFYQRAKHYL